MLFLKSDAVSPPTHNASVRACFGPQCCLGYRSIAQAPPRPARRLLGPVQVQEGGYMYKDISIRIYIYIRIDVYMYIWRECLYRAGQGRTPGGPAAPAPCAATRTWSWMISHTYQHQASPQTRPDIGRSPCRCPSRLHFAFSVEGVCMRQPRNRVR